MHKTMYDSTRRNFIKLAGIAVPGMMIPNLTKAYSNPLKAGFEVQSKKPIKLGIASYTFREFSLEDTIRMTKLVGMKNIAFKSMHLPLDSTDQEIREVKKKVKNNGLHLYGAGVIYMTSREEVMNAFRYAKAAGMTTIIGVPNHDLLDLVDEQVKATGIQVAIHNHGPGDDVYPSPESIVEKVKHLDKRIGMCMDIGHTQRIGLDPADEAEKYFDRLLDVHLKDVDKSTAEGETVEIGRGIIDIPKFLSVLIKNKFSGVASFEYEKDEKDPLAGLAESVGYINGVLDVIKN
jgi:sugar phosphate isomerase/epimerase